jgi:kelch-like protein 2/3
LFLLQVIALISSDKLTVPSEEIVFESVLNWINHEQESRKEHVPILMENVRLPLLSQDYLLHRVDEEPLVQLNGKCKDLLIEALKFHLLRGEQKATFSSPRTKPRQALGLPKVILVVGGQAPKAIRCVESYDFKVRDKCFWSRL